ncbi:MAG: 5-formyltetrahydrofolate cyclo-ligase [Pseudomonadota bacterium]
MTHAALKEAARAAAMARRAEAHAAHRGDAARHLRAVLAAHAGRPLSGYMPMRSEIDPLPAMAAHRGPVAVPVIEGKGQPLRFRAWHPSAPMIPGRFGALIPETGDWITPEVLIVPLVAFDRAGNRLGYGGGFYDRTLEALRARGPVTAIGFAWAAQETDALPLEPTDQPLDLIVTETGILRPVR